MFEVELGLGPMKELVVFRVGARPATLDERHTQVIEEAGHSQLVRGCQRNALLLRAVAQGGVVDLD